MWLQESEILIKSVRDQHLPVKLPAVLGHEGAGIVKRIGTDVTKVKIGDSVVLAPSSCGICSYCLSGHPSYCTELFVLNAAGSRPDGTNPYHGENGKLVGGFFFGQSSFATYSLTSESNVVKVPTDVPLEIMGPLGCGLQTGAGTVLNVLKPGAGESIAIFGIGPVGLAALMAAKAMGCTTIVAIDIHESRLSLAKTLGATHIINSAVDVPSIFINEQVLAGGVHYSVDTTGRNDVINQAIGSLRAMGKCAIVGVSASIKLEIDYMFFNGGKSIQYVNEGDSIPDIFIPRLISLYKAGLFPFDKLIRFYALENINQAVTDTESGATLKAVIKMPVGQ